MVSSLALYYLILTVFSFTMTGCEVVLVFKAFKGETVHLPCHSPFTDSEQVSVEWTKISRNGTTTSRWNIYSNTVSSTEDCISNFSFTKMPFTLDIESVQLSDSGDYSCKTTRVIPPPTLDDISNLRLQVTGLSMQLLNSSNDTCIHLLCSLESLDPELVNFTWSREGQRSLHPSKSSAMNSELHLCKPDWSDGDTITCHGSYSRAQTSLRKNITLDFSSKESRQDFPVVFVAFFSIFIIAISFIWILFWVLTCRE